MNAEVPTNASFEMSDSGETTLADRVARKLFLRILAKFRSGRLRVKLPEGDEILYGDDRNREEPAELHIHHNGFFRQVVLYGEIGFGEAFTAGQWSSPDVTALLECLIRNLVAIPGMSGGGRRGWINLLGAGNRFFHWLRRNSVRNSRRNIEEHYDLSNDFYKLWLDPGMTYSSAWFPHPATDLPQAQDYKYSQLARRMDLQPGMHILEIGCGWGGFATYAARNHGVKVTGLTISQQQYEEARRRVTAERLDDRIDIQLCDYRHAGGSYDGIVSIEMLEAVGHEYLDTFFAKCQQLLKPGGCLGLQVILCPDARYEQMRKSVDWIKRHIFPGGQLPSLSAILAAIRHTGDLCLHHLDSFGTHYGRTLREWRDAFQDKTDEVVSLGFDDRFVRKWYYYLAYCEAAFNTYNITVSQMIFTRPNNDSYCHKAEWPQPAVT